MTNGEEVTGAAPTHWRDGIRWWQPLLAFVALLFAAFTVVGSSFQRTATAIDLTRSTASLARSVLLIALLAVLIYAALVALFSWLDRRDRRLPTTPTTTMTAAMRRWFIPCWLPISGAWLVWLALHYPGNMDADTMAQRLQWMGLAKPSDHHPWFDTMVFGWFWDLGDALGNAAFGFFGYLVVQVLALGAGVAFCLCYLTKLGLSRRIRLALVIIAAFSPATLTLSIMMSKDGLSTIFWLPFLVLYAEIARTRGRILRRVPVSAAMVCICCLLVLTKRTNIYLAALSLVVLLIVVSKRFWLPLVAGFVGVAVVTLGLWTSVILPAWGVQKPTSNDMLSIPTQQTARIVKEHGPEVPPDERATIDTMLRWNTLAKVYAPERSDAVKARWRDDAPAAQKRAYFEVWFKQLFRYPGTAASATAANTYQYFTPTTPLRIGNENNFSAHVDNWKKLSYPSTSRAEIQTLADEIEDPDALQGVRDKLRKTVEILPDRTFFASMAFYASWLPILLAVAAIRRRNWFQLACCWPAFINLAFLVAGPIAFARYLIPATMFSSFLLGLLFTAARWEPRQEIAVPVDDDRDARAAAHPTEPVLAG